jgi:hypothetical protein
LQTFGEKAEAKKATLHTAEPIQPSTPTLNTAQAPLAPLPSRGPHRRVPCAVDPARPASHHPHVLPPHVRRRLGATDSHNASSGTWPLRRVSSFSSFPTLREAPNWEARREMHGLVAPSYLDLLFAIRRRGARTPGGAHTVGPEDKRPTGKTTSATGTKEGCKKVSACSGERANVWPSSSPRAGVHQPRPQGDNQQMRRQHVGGVPYGGPRTYRAR